MELRPGDVLELEFREYRARATVLGTDGAGHPVLDFEGHLVGPFREEPSWRPEPMALEEIQLFGSRMPVQLSRIARGAPVPERSGYRRILGRNLLYMLSSVAVRAQADQQHST